MFLQSETYPGVGHHQQSYRVVQDGYYYYSPNDHYRHVSVMPMPPSPSITAPHLVPNGGHAQQPNGWYGTNKQQLGWHGHGSNGQMSPYNCNDAPKFQGGWNSTGTDYHTYDSNGQMSPNNYNDAPKFPGGWHNAGTVYHSHESNGQMSPNNYNDAPKFPGGWHNTGTDYSVHGSNAHMLAYNHSDTSKFPSGGGYGAYHGAHSPMGANRMESIGCNFNSGSDGRDRSPTVYNYPTELQNGYQKVEWTLKGVEEDEE